MALTIESGNSKHNLFNQVNRLELQLDGLAAAAIAGRKAKFSYVYMAAEILIIDRMSQLDLLRNRLIRLGYLD